MTINRREFLQIAALGVAIKAARAADVASPARSAIKSITPRDRFVRTVTGPASRDELGRALAHEHVLVDFIGAAAIKPGRYNADQVFDKVVPYIREAATAGVQAIFECTPNFIGRDPVLLRRLSESSGVRLITNTGLYGARDGMFLPSYVQEESAAQLARRWIAETSNGIGDTGIRPGFIKSGVKWDPLESTCRHASLSIL